MARRDQVRDQRFLPGSVSERFEVLAAKSGASKSAILAAAVTAFLDRRDSSELEERFTIRLNLISNQLARIERDGQVRLESLGLFIRYMLTLNVPVAGAGDDRA